MKFIKQYISITAGYILLMTVLSGLLFIVSSCEEEPGPPVITNVRTPDPATADSTVEKAFPGDFIVIQGENLEGVTHVYFNNVEAYFNRIYVTNTNIIVQIPSEIPLKGIDPSVPNEIRVVTPQGEATYSFKFLSPQPSINFLFFDVPASVDTNIFIYGSNFYEVLGVTFMINDQQIEVQDYDIHDYSIISFRLPDGAQYDGKVMVITESGSDTLDFIPNPPPVITGVSRDLTVIGDTFTIYGRDFRSIDKVIFPGGIEVDQSKLTINELKTEIVLIMPYAPATGDLKVIRGDIEAVYPDFNDRSLVLYDFDGIGNWVWHWDTTSTFSSGDMTAGNRKFYRFASTCPANGGWYDEGANGIAISAWPNIPSATPIEKLALSININAMMPWTDGWIEISFLENSYGYKLQPYLTSEVPVNKWITYTIPLKSFTGMSYVTYADIRALAVDNAFLVYINGDSAVPFDYDFCWDDLRFVVLE
ncbi:MAG: hypothetical protein JXR41_04645 [Bacteroidales bacterium]|nr:hypothetical protein [Bacteroidales bacterium]MBN2762359.1 hypothetical protein [Bacteroidales bacterium]